ncbi:MAG: bifunctional riboflavin kinase/FAD synthetase [Gammaproteobacteria bacterium]
MRLIRGLNHLESLHQGCVLTIGNFDGVHLGHRAVIEKLDLQGKRLGVPVIVMLFEPQPLEYFLGSKAPSRLTRLREKAIQFGKLAVDRLLVLRFDRTLAECDPESFIRDILVGRLNVRYLAVGDDFRFGRERRGDFALLREKGAHYGFEVEDTRSLTVRGERVSSTLIRQALEQGRLDDAKSFLGRLYSVCGRVVHGEKRGRTLGFPTANIQMFRKNSPVDGVFFVSMTGFGAEEKYGVANVGTRPTVAGGSEVLLETHLFDFDEEIYGHYVEVHFRKRIRSEMHFKSLKELQARIALDVREARRLLDLLREEERIY